MNPNDQDQRDKESEEVITAATESLTRAQLATEQAQKAIQAALRAGAQAQQQLAARRRARA